MRSLRLDDLRRGRPCSRSRGAAMTTGTLRIHHDGNGHVGRCPGLTEKPCTRPGTYRLMIMGWLAGEPVCAVCAKEAERAWLNAGGAPALRTARKRRLAR